MLGRVALDPVLAPGAGDDGGDEVEAGLELHLVVVLVQWQGFVGLGRLCFPCKLQEGGLCGKEAVGGKAAQVCGSELAWKQGMNHSPGVPASYSLRSWGVKLSIHPIDQEQDKRPLPSHQLTGCNTRNKPKKHLLLEEAFRRHC